MGELLPRWSEPEEQDEASAPPSEPAEYQLCRFVSPRGFGFPRPFGRMPFRPGPVCSPGGSAAAPRYYPGFASYAAIGRAREQPQQQALQVLAAVMRELIPLLRELRQLFSRHLGGSSPPPADRPRTEALPGGGTRQFAANGHVDRDREGHITFARIGDRMYLYIPGTLDDWHVVTAGSDTRQRGSIRLVGGRLQFVRDGAPPPGPMVTV